MIKQRIRLEWIDALRALAILLVVFGHRYQPVPFIVFFNPIKMPLFFALSGFLFRIKPGGDIAFFKKTITSLVIPWLCLGLVPLILSIPFKGFAHALHSAADLLTGELLWFMPCFIIAQVIFYYVVKMTEKHLPLMVLTIVTISAIGYILKQKDIMTTFMFNLAMMVQFYFMIGYLYKKYEVCLRPYRLWLGIVLLICYIIIGWVTYPGGATDLHNGLFYNLPIATSMTIIGLLTLFLLSSCIKKYPKFILSVGKNSLAIYMLDRYALLPFLFLFNYIAHPDSFIIIILIVLVYLVYSSTICIMIAKVLNKYVPWTTGGRG